MLILFAAAIVPACPRPITLMAKSTFQHRRMRMPSMTQVSADINNDLITLSVTGYNGTAIVTINDENGEEVSSSSFEINGSSSYNFSVDNLTGGEYSITIYLRSTSFIGFFDID